MKTNRNEHICTCTRTGVKQEKYKTIENTAAIEEEFGRVHALFCEN